MKTLTVTHNIFLDRDQRYRLVAGEEVEAVGVSVPVWFSKGKSTEPAQEVFCKYKLYNRPETFPINTWEEGYTVVLPQPHETMQKVVDTLAANTLIGEKLRPPDAKNLLDFKDGGSAYLSFKQYTKVHSGKRSYNILHFVEIKDVADLVESLAY